MTRAYNPSSSYSTAFAYSTIRYRIEIVYIGVYYKKTHLNVDMDFGGRGGNFDFKTVLCKADIVKIDKNTFGK